MAEITLRGDNPTGPDAARYQRMLWEKAPDSVVTPGTPGTFAQIANVSFATTGETTAYVYYSAITTDWFRYRWADTGLTVFGDYSDPLQFGDSLAVEWVIKDLPNATDLKPADYYRWRDQVIAELITDDIGLWAPSQNVSCASYTDEFHDIAETIGKVTRVELYSTDGYYMSTLSDWEQQYRTLRIMDPIPGITYKVSGIGEIKSLTDCPDELFVLIGWGIRIHYLQRRLDERSFFRKMQAATRTDDTVIGQLIQMRDHAQAQYDLRVMKNKRFISAPAWTYR